MKRTETTQRDTIGAERMQLSSFAVQPRRNSGEASVRRKLVWAD